MAVTRTFDIPARGHSLAATLREINDAGGVAVRVELKPQSPFSGDPEFDSSDLSAWTQTNSGNAVAINANTEKSHLQIQHPSTSTNWNGATRNAPFVHQVVSGDFDVFTRVKYGDLRDTQFIAIKAQSSSNADDWIRLVGYFNTGQANKWVLEFVDTDNASSTQRQTVALQSGEVLFGGFAFLRLSRSSNTFTGSYSLDGVTWTALTSSASRTDFSTDANVGVSAGQAGGTANNGRMYFDFLRSWPPYVTTSPVGSVVIDSGVNGTTWDMSTFDALINMYQEYNPQSQSGFGTLKFKYGASDSNPPSLNGSYLTEAQMQAEADPSGRYFKLEVQYTSANGYEQASFNGAKIDGTFTAGGLLRHPGMSGGCAA